jgi:N-methylhydantoinase A/oxoprolinase/acetone carboxylase beta subunit
LVRTHISSVFPRLRSSTFFPAQSLGVSRIVIHRFSSVLSAYGLALADRVHELQEPCSDVYSKEKTLPTLLKRLDSLEAKVRKALEKQGFDKDKIRVERFLNMRWVSLLPCVDRSLNLCCADTRAPTLAS